MIVNSKSLIHLTIIVPIKSRQVVLRIPISTRALLGDTGGDLHKINKQIFLLLGMSHIRVKRKREFKLIFQRTRKIGFKML